MIAACKLAFGRGFDIEEKSSTSWKSLFLGRVDVHGHVCDKVMMSRVGLLSASWYIIFAATFTRNFLILLLLLFRKLQLAGTVLFMASFTEFCSFIVIWKP